MTRVGQVYWDRVLGVESCGQFLGVEYRGLVLGCSAGVESCRWSIGVKYWVGVLEVRYLGRY